MSYTYTFDNAEGTSLKREDDQGNIVFVPTDPRNRDYAEYLSSGVTAAAYVAPAAAPELTDTEKLEASTGLTVAEIKTVLGIY